MKVLLQNIDNGMFLGNFGSWTDDCAEAQEFPNSISALTFCNAHEISGVQVVLHFEQPRYDMTLPFHASSLGAN